MSLFVGEKVGKMFKGYGFWQGEVIEMTETHVSVAWAWPQPEEPTMERITGLERLNNDEEKAGSIGSSYTHDLLESFTPGQRVFLDVVDGSVVSVEDESYGFETCRA